MTFEKKFRLFAKVYESARKTRFKIVEKRETPSWVETTPGEPQEYSVYFKDVNDEPKYSLMCGHGKSWEDAYRMLLNFYMEKYQLSWPEIEIRAAAIGKA